MKQPETKLAYEAPVVEEYFVLTNLNLLLNMSGGTIQDGAEEGDSDTFGDEWM